MLPRLSSSLPSASAFASRRGSQCLWALPLSTRFNSNVAQPSPDVPSPKKRAIPLAENLGDINITRKGQNRGGFRRDRQQNDGAPREGNVQSRQNNRGPRDANGQARRFNGPPRERNGEFRGRRDGQQASRVQGESAQRSPKQARREEPSKPRQAEGAAPQKVQTLEARESQKARTPSVPKPLSMEEIDLGSIDYLDTTSELPAPAVNKSRKVTQLLLEKAGDYSRFLPRRFDTTDVQKLGPVGLGELVLSRKKDTVLQSRADILNVVKKFSGAGNGPRASS